MVICHLFSICILFFKSNIYNLNFDFSLNELVKHEKNGYVFQDYLQLKTQIFNWFKDFPNNEEENAKQNEIRNNIKEFQELGWSENWKINAFPYFN